MVFVVGMLATAFIHFGLCSVSDADDSPPTAFIMGRDSVKHKLPEAEAAALARLISKLPEIAPAHPSLYPIYRVLIDDTEYVLDTDSLILIQKDRTKIWRSPGIEKRILKAAGIRKP